MPSAGLTVNDRKQGNQKVYVERKGFLIFRLIQTHLVLTLLPPPQVLVHLVQGVHSVQVGHPSVLQGRISQVSPGQPCWFVPLEFLADGSRQSRIRFVVPPPQVAVH